MKRLERSAEVKQRGLSLGFDAVGIAPLEPNPHAADLDRWLAAGYAGTMSYLHRQADKRKDPRHIMPEATAAVVTLAVLATVGHVLFHHRGRSELTRPAVALLVLVAGQIALGGFIIWSERAVAVNTAHVITGALVLATSLVLTLRSYRPLFRSHAPESQRQPMPVAAGVRA